MRYPLFVRLSVIVVLLLSSTAPAWAFKKESRVPLLGCRGHYAASGAARYLTFRNEPKMTDHEELIIEIKNVPLPPGTTLIVYVTDEAVGTVKLDRKQTATLTLTSSFGKLVPPIDAGTSVVVKTVDGRDVMW